MCFQWGGEVWGGGGGVLGGCLSHFSHKCEKTLSFVKLGSGVMAALLTDAQRGGRGPTSNIKLGTHGNIY